MTDGAEQLLADWPLFGLRLRTERLELRPPTDADLVGLLAATDAGIHPPESMPFSLPWTDQPPERRRRESLQHWWRQRAEWRPDDWHLPFAVLFEGRPVGVQDLFARNFELMREAETASWLTRQVQGRGLGREMRGAVVEFAFGTLGAEVVRTSAFTDNAASIAVTTALGYRENGRRRAAPRGEVREMIAFELRRPDWEARRPPGGVRVEGFDACRPMFTSA